VEGTEGWEKRGDCNVRREAWSARHREWSALTDAAANRIEGRRSCRICASASAADAGAAGVMGDGGGKQERTSGESRGRKHYTSHGARGGSAATDRHDLLPQEGKL
jgi:hypothetical protein